MLSSSTIKTVGGASLLGSGDVGTIDISYGGTGQTTKAAAFNALSPITTTGDLIVGNGTNSATRFAVGAEGTVLKSNGTTVSWELDATPPLTLTSTTFTLSGAEWPWLPEYDSVIVLDTDRTLLLFWNYPSNVGGGGGYTSDLYAIVHDSSTNTVGSPTLIGSWSDAVTVPDSVMIPALKIATDKVLIAYSANDVAYSRVLSFSGTTITVGAAAQSSAFGTNISALGNKILTVGSVYYTTYSLGSEYGIIAFGVSGTTVTVSDALSLPLGGYVNSAVGRVGLCFVNLSSTMVLAGMIDSWQAAIFVPITFSGITPSAGTSVTSSQLSGNMSVMTYGGLLSSGRAVFIGYTDESPTSMCGFLISVSGTTASIDDEDFYLTNYYGNIMWHSVNAKIIGNQVLFGAAYYNSSYPYSSVKAVNVFTDDNGSLIVGTDYYEGLDAIQGSNFAAINDMWFNGNDLYCYADDSQSGSAVLGKFTISNNSPQLTLYPGTSVANNSQVVNRPSENDYSFNWNDNYTYSPAGVLRGSKYITGQMVNATPLSAFTTVTGNKQITYPSATLLGEVVTSSDGSVGYSLYILQPNTIQITKVTVA